MEFKEYLKKIIEKSLTELNLIQTSNSFFDLEDA